MCESDQFVSQTVPNTEGSTAACVSDVRRRNLRFKAARKHGSDAWVGWIGHLMSRNATAVVLTMFCLLAGGGASNSEAAVDRGEYELQERCGRRAAEMFEKEHGTGFYTTQDGYTRTTYFSNYNSIFNKCYMRIYKDTHGREKPGSTPPTYDIITLELRDVNSNKSIGFCVYMKGKLPDSDGCYFAGNAVESADEWEMLEKAYME